MSVTASKRFTDPAPQEYELHNHELARRAARDGIVLLKNEDHTLPLAAGCRVALYGMGALHTVKGGTGSGDVNVRATVNICDGMRTAGFTIANEDYLKECEEIYQAKRSEWRDLVWKRFDNKEYPYFFAAYVNTPFMTPACPEIAPCDCDAVFYVISRNAGEGADRTLEKGDYLLSEAEHSDISRLCSLYPSVTLVINSGGIIDLSILDEYPQIKAVLLLSQAGIESGNAFADIVSGRSCPCGKLTDSWPIAVDDHLCMQPKNRECVDNREVYYHEGIYVGYRYFDTFGVPVRYSFGHGLSYTDFSIKTTGIHVSYEPAACVDITLSVFNTGTQYSGREVVQIYATCPLGGLHKENRRLVGFAKTAVIAPRETQELTVSIPFDRFVSYDKCCQVLSMGKYYLWAGNSLSNAHPIGTLTLDSNITIEENKRLWAKFDGVDTLFPDPGQCTALRMSLERYVLMQQLPTVALDAELVAKHLPAPHAAPAEPDLRKRAADIAGKLSVEQLIRTCVGHWAHVEESQLGSAGVSVPGSAGETTDILIPEGVRPMVLADGPAGLRLKPYYFEKDGTLLTGSVEHCFENGYLAREEFNPGGTRCYQYCTAFPIGTLLAQTWDSELLKEVGRAVADEMHVFGVSLWLAPGMNIHRDPLCGRNFEYFSEDPLVSGLAASAITAGVQSVPGCGVTIKHFACNNAEHFRLESNSIVSERALREIYLRGFEIAVKDSQPTAVMTSYNLVNGEHAANSARLCTSILRDEWGFDGLVMTDWGTTGSSRCTPFGCIHAGNDLLMPGCRMECEDLFEALNAGKISHDELVRCAANIIYISLRLVPETEKQAEN